MSELEHQRMQAMRNAYHDAYNRSGLANANAGPRYGDTTLNPDRKLTGQFRDYLTTVDITHPCEQLPPDYQYFIDHTKSDDQLDAAFEAWMEELDQENGEKT